MTGGPAGWVFDAERVNRLRLRYDAPPQDIFTDLTNFTNLTEEAVLSILMKVKTGLAIHQLQSALESRNFDIDNLNDILAALERKGRIINNTDKGLISLRRSQ